MNNITERMQRRGNDNSKAATTTIKQIKKRGNGSKSKQHAQAEKTLLESEMYRELFEKAIDMIVLVDGETGKILDINMAGCKLLGLPKKKIIGKHQSVIHPPELADEHKQRFQVHARRGGTKSDNVIVQRADGTQIPMDVSASVIKLGDKTIIQGIFRDSTEHAGMEKALRESVEKFSKAFQYLPDQVSIARKRDQVFIDVNDNFCRNNGYTREEVIGRKGDELDLPIKPGAWDKVRKMVIERGRAENVEIEFKDKAGKTRTMQFSTDNINIGGEPCLLTIGNDISQRKQADKALRESEEKFSKAFHASPEAMGIITEKDSKFIDVNDSYVQMTGYSKEELLGKTTTSTNLWLTPEDKEKINKILLKKGRVHKEETDYRTKSGEIRTRLLSLERITINGEPCRIGVSTDITELKRMEKALEKEKSFLSSILTSIQDSVIVLDNKLNVISANKTAEEWFAPGMPLIGKKCYKACHDQSKPCEDCPARQTLETGKAAERVVPRHGPDGMITGWSELYTFPIFDTQTGKITGVIEYGRDITARKQAEDALHESEEKFSKAFQSSPEAIAIVTLKDGKFIDVNDSYVRMTGYSREEIIGNTTTSLSLAVNPEGPKIINRIMREKGRIYNEELGYRTKSGEIRTRLFSLEPITIKGEPCRFSVSIDITERKKMEQALQVSEEKFSKAFRTLPEQVTIVRMKDGVFMDVNDSFCRYNGYTREEVIGHKREELDLLIGPRPRAQFTKIMKEKGRAENIELECKDKSGETRTLLFSADIINIGGEPCQLTIANDITERKKMEQAVKESEEKFSGIFQSSPDAVSLITIEDERYIDINDGYLKMTGYSREELVGNTSYSINLWVNEENHARMHKMMREQGRIYNEEFDYRTKSGEIRTRLFSLEPITIKGEQCTLGVSTDITERKRTEQALKESEEKFSNAFQAIPEVVTLVRMKDGVFVDVNETFCRNNGYTREEVIGRKGNELNLPIKPSDWARVTKMVKERGRADDVELEFRDKSGESHTMLFSSDIIDLAGEPCLLTIGKDITERKRMEQVIKESEEKFSKAFQAMPEEVTIVRMKDNTFIDVNETFCRNNGYTREEVVGRKGDELNLSIKSSDWAQITKMVKERGRADDIELEFRDESDELHTLLFSSDIIDLGGEPCLLTIGKDITERKKIEQALRESEEKFSKAFRASPDAMGIVRVKDGQFIDVNDSYVLMTGYSREELTGNTAYYKDIWVSAKDNNKINKLLEENGRIHNEEIKYRTKSGEIRTRLLSLEPINISGEPCRIGVSTDITERKLAEKKLKEALADLEQSSALLKATNKELESFSYSVSHDLRSPLRSIAGFSQALLEDYSTKLDETGQDYLNRLSNASQKMGELIDGLLKLSRLTRSEMHHEKVDLTSLANEIAARLQETNPERNVKFIIGENLKANGDPQMLRVLLENLLGNALKFTKNTKEGCIEFGSITEDEGKTFFIKDNGAGFDMAFEKKLFGAFQRLHDEAEYPGTGIGLATVQRIINRHGGSIRAEGELDKGATFYFTLS